MKPENRRVLVLVAKVLQNLANGMEFGAKESCMIPMNSFISSNLQAVINFFQTLAVRPKDFFSLMVLNDSLQRPRDGASTGTNSDEIVVTQDDIFTDILLIHKYLDMFMDKISQVAQENPSLQSTPIPIGELTNLVKTIKQETEDEKFATSILP